MTIDQKVGIGLAYVYARDRQRMPNHQAYKWAKSHWPEFLSELDTPTGQMLLRACQNERKEKTHDHA